MQSPKEFQNAAQGPELALSFSRGARLLNIGRTLVLFMVSVIASGCTNALFNSLRGITSKVDTPNGIQEDQSFLQVTRIVRSNQDPTSNFDLLGDGSGQIGQYCGQTISGNEGAPTTTACVCAFQYITTTGDLLQVEAPSIYVESDLLRCSYGQIPAGLNFVRVRIRLTTVGDVYSNETTVNLTGSGTTLSLTDPSSFRTVQRFQCKETLYIPMMWGDSSGVYDPLLSEDPTFVYPFNFYTTNLARSLDLMSFHPYTAPVTSNGRNVGWQCPAVPNDPSLGMDTRVWSVLDYNGDYVISPPRSGSLDRQSFSLMRQPSGPFNVPVNAYVAPNLYSRNKIGQPHDTSLANAGGPEVEPMGYGVQPIVIGDDEEACPDTSVVIPSGYQWVKVWLFRASLEDRKIPVTPDFSLLGPIVCNPRKRWASRTPAQVDAIDYVFPNCGTLNGALNSSQITERVFQSIGEACMLPQGSQGGRSTNASGVVTSSFPVAPGTDLWQPNSIQNTNPLCQISQNLSLCSGSTPVGTHQPPRTQNVQAQSLDGEISRADYLFVVSLPNEVHTRDFKRNTDQARRFLPYRFMSASDCVSGQPWAPPQANDCQASKMVRYNHILQDISVNPDTPTQELLRLPKFPICALQKIGGSP
jgi:hypothetical protein